jgi:hypothetical protein
MRENPDSPDYAILLFIPYKKNLYLNFNLKYTSGPFLRSETTPIAYLRIFSHGNFPFNEIS